MNVHTSFISDKPFDLIFWLKRFASRLISDKEASIPPGLQYEISKTSFFVN